MRWFARLLVLWLLLLSHAHAAEVRIMGLFSNKAVLMIDGNRRILAAGETSPEGVKLISADSETAVLEINGQRQERRLGTHIGSSFTAAKKRSTRITPTGGMYMSDGRINNRSVEFLVDTGATFVVMNSQYADRLGVDYQEGQLGMVETASGMEKAWQVKLDSVSVGPVQVRNVDGMVLEGAMPSKVLLGMSFLSRVEMERVGTVLVLTNKF